MAFNHISIIVLLTTIFPILSFGVVAWADVEVINGRAFDDQGRLAYLERHTITHKDGRILKIDTVYTDADHRQIGRTESDFSSDTRLGNYDFRDDRLEYYDGARVYSDHIAIFCRETPNQDMQLKYLPREPNQVLGQGFNQFIIDRLDAIAAGEIVHAKLILPAKQDQFGVVIRKDRIVDDQMLIRVDVDSWFLKLFVPHIEVVFDMDARRLLRYRGISMIADESGKSIGVTVTYDYRDRTTLVKTD